LIASIRDTLSRALRGIRDLPDRVVAVGGTAATLASMQLGLRTVDPARIHGLRLSRSQIYVWLIVLSLLSVRQRLALPGLEPGRADIIVAGTAVLAGVLGALGAPELTVSTRGLRYGLLLNARP
jgi:exopolyphosphatase/guanosine-5'-triphosphate,3'-diphosphate pyrophosphatase